MGSSSMKLDAINNDITSRLLADITHNNGDLGSRTWTDGISGLHDDAMEQGHHIQAMTDVSVRMVPLAAQC